MSWEPRTGRSQVRAEGPGPPAKVMLVEGLQVLRVLEEEHGAIRVMGSRNTEQRGRKQDEIKEQQSSYY